MLTFEFAFSELQETTLDGITSEMISRSIPYLLASFPLGGQLSSNTYR